MTQVNVEDILEHLDSDIRPALAEAVEVVLDASDVDDQELYDAFLAALCQRLGTWETVPDDFCKDDLAT